MKRYGLILLAVLGACSGATDGVSVLEAAQSLQLNDVSILFPLASSEAEFHDGYLTADAPGEHGPLLPSALYDAVGHIAGSTITASSGGPTPDGAGGEAAYADLRVVAVRVDPCFAALAPDPHGGGCTNQLRVIFQPLMTTDGKAKAFDSALHVFYSLSREEVIAFAQAMAALRIAHASPGERLGALAPHPLMIREGLTGPTAMGARALVTEYATSDRITRIAKMSLINSQFTWTFNGFEVSAVNPPRIAPMAMASLAPETSSQTFFRGFTDALKGQFSPPTESKDDLTPLANADTATTLDASQRSAAFGALLRIENPARHSPNTIDCASCHVATAVQKLVAEPVYALYAAGNSNAYASDGKSVLPSEMTATVPPDNVLSVHAFSYATAASISQRTVNETAAVVEYLNAL